MRRRALLSTVRTALLTTPLAALAGCSGFESDATDSPTEPQQLSDTPTSTNRPTDSPTPTERPTQSPTASPTPTPAAVQTPENGSLEVIEHALLRSNDGSESELATVAATVSNTGAEAVTNVRIVTRFFDIEQTLLDERSARTDRIAASGAWDVELTFGGSGDEARAVTDYRLIIERLE